MDSDTIKRKALQGKDYFNNGYYCAESVLMAVADAVGLVSELIPRIATGFCSGMARTKGVCGAVTGGILAINLLTGRDTATDSVELNYELVETFLERFEIHYPSQYCDKLSGCDLGTPEGQLYFQKNNVHETCGDYVAETVKMVLELLVEFDVPFMDNRKNGIKNT